MCQKISATAASDIAIGTTAVGCLRVDQRIYDFRE